MNPEHTQKQRTTRISTGAKVKSGCRTCKIRRVKCDEGRPSCQRCIHSGRLCDGYGVWGGGAGNAYGAHSVLSRRHITPGPLGAANVEERACFEWFMNRAEKKLPGVFGSQFWETLVFQASAKEPAVFHALLAISSAHKGEMLNENGSEIQGCIPDLQERFTLRQYAKAIGYLQPHFSTSERKESIRVLLVSCIVFICLEFLRGHYESGRTHLQNGLRLLSKIQDAPQTTGEISMILNSHKEFTDDCLVEAFCQLYVQSALFEHFHLQFHVVKQDQNFLAPIFTSIKQARQSLDQLLNEIRCLEEQSRATQDSHNLPHPPIELVSRKQYIQKSLSSWLYIYKAPRVSLKSKLSSKNALAYPLLRIYHIMAQIMIDSCLSRADELIFDSYTDQFTLIITESIELLKAASPVSTFELSSGYCSEKFSFTAELGLIPPIYYVALKCRVHKIRAHAIELLRTMAQQEGIWNGVFVAEIAQRVMESEEGICYGEFSVNSGISLCETTPTSALIPPALCKLPRIHRVQVELPDDAAHPATVLFKRTKPEDGEELIESTKVLLSQH